MIDVRQFHLETFHGHPIGAHWTRFWVFGLACNTVGAVEEGSNWSELVRAHRSSLDIMASTGLADCNTLAVLHIAIDIVETVELAPELHFLAVDFLMHVALTEEEIPAPGEPLVPPEQGPTAPLDGCIPLQSLPFAWRREMVRRGQREVLRQLLMIPHEQLSAAIKQCVRHSRNLEEWQAGMVRQLIYHERMKVSSLTYGDRPSYIENLFTPEEITTLTKQERYAAEQFAHLGTALGFRRHLQESLDELTEKARTIEGDTLRLRTELRAMRARYEVPPYLVPELEALLRAARRPGGT
ncbi:hypothetical protein ACFYT5_23350 [Streptomyces anulatus]|uniref:hypothetical protein n=1 Tax=Streptomyces anulatus TaxID=1892 RepID=UPI0036C2B40A